jgi:hypothetical protein
MFGLNFKRKRKKDTKLSRKLAIRPLLYIIITIALVIYDYGTLHLFSVLPLLFIFVGVPIGVAISGDAKIRKGLKSEIYYQRSRITLIVWIIAIVIRIYVEFVLPSSFLTELLADSIIGITAGILIGEVRFIAKRARELIGEVEKL